MLPTFSVLYWNFKNELILFFQGLKGVIALKSPDIILCKINHTQWEKKCHSKHAWQYDFRDQAGQNSRLRNGVIIFPFMCKPNKILFCIYSFGILKIRKTMKSGHFTLKSTSNFYKLSWGLMKPLPKGSVLLLLVTCAWWSLFCTPPLSGGAWVWGSESWR